MRTGGTPAEWKIIPIAPGTDIVASPDPEGVFLGNPSIAVMPGGRIVVSLDMTGPGTKRLPGTKLHEPTTNRWMQGKIFVSADKGKTWTCKVDFPFQQAQLFRVGSTLYIMGRAGDFRAMKSLDGGEMWSKPVELIMDDGEYVLTSANVLCAGDHVYLAAMRRAQTKERSASYFSPVILRAKQGMDLTSRKSWSCSEPAGAFHEFAPAECLAYFGVNATAAPVRKGEPAGAQRAAGQLDWDAPHLVTVNDPNHIWHDPAGRTIHLLASTRLRRSNLAAVARVIEDDSGRMLLSPVQTISGSKTALVPLPGGHLKFDVAYDETSRLYWLAGNPSQDSMANPGGRLTRQRDERQQLCLYFSRNLTDWHFAACLDSGPSPEELRHCCSMAIAGNDLFLVCCSGHLRPGIRGCTDRITFHSVPSFRELEY